MLDFKHKDPKISRDTNITKIKEKLAFLNNKDEKTQEELDDYISCLSDNKTCKYMKDFKDVINLCNNHLFECNFKSKERFKFENSLKPECKRVDILRLKSIL